MSKYHTSTDDERSAVGTLRIGSSGMAVGSPTWQVKGEESFPRTSRQASMAERLRLTLLFLISPDSSLSVDAAILLLKQVTCLITASSLRAGSRTLIGMW